MSYAALTFGRGCRKFNLAGVYTIILQPYLHLSTAISPKVGELNTH